MRLDWWKSIEGILRNGERAFVCFVAEATKGSPGSPGAAIAIALSCAPFGTIGGGKMELDLIEEATAALGAGAFLPRCETLHHHAVSEGRASGLICGGSQTHVSLVLDPDRDLETLEAILEAVASDAVGGLEVTPNGLNFLADNFASHRALVCEGDDWSFREGLSNPRRIAILGGGHCGVALAGAMRRLGYAVQVFETRENLFTFAQLPANEAVRLENFAAAGELIARPSSTFAIVVTSAYPTDVDALAGLLPLPLPFIGLMGTRLKIARIRGALTERGFAPNDLDRVTAPVGLAMDSDTPEEIAVSIAAQILLTRKDLI